VLDQTAAWRTDGEYIAAGVKQDGVHIVNSHTGDFLIVTGNPQQPATRLEWQPNGNLLAVLNGRRGDQIPDNIIMWDYDDETGIAEQLMVIPHAYDVVDMAWTPDGTTLASGERLNFIRLSRPEQPNQINTVQPNIFGTERLFISSLDWDQTGQTIAVGYIGSGNDGAMLLSNISTGVTQQGSINALVNKDWIWTPENHLMWAGWGNSNNLSISGEHLQDSDSPYRSFTGLNDSVLRSQFSPDTRLILGYDVDHNAIIWDVATQAIISEFDNVNGAVWSPDSTMVAVYESDGVIRIVDARSGETVDTLDDHFQFNAYDNQNSRRAQVIWSPDSQRIAVLDSGVLFIYDQPN